MTTKDDLLDPTKWTADVSQMECRHECGLVFIFEKNAEDKCLDSQAHNIEAVEGVQGIFYAELLAKVASLAGEVFNETFSKSGGWDGE